MQDVSISVNDEQLIQFDDSVDLIPVESGDTPHAGVDIVTFGCRLNHYESEVIRKLAHEAAWSDTIVINTCAVTAEAERQARQAIRKLHRQHPNKAIVVTGCSAQIQPKPYLDLPVVTQVIGNHEKLQPESYVALPASDTPRIWVQDISLIRETASHLISGSTDTIKTQRRSGRSVNNTASRWSRKCSEVSTTTTRSSRLLPSRP